MLARTLRFAQLLELAACLAVGAWLHRAYGWSGWSVMAATVAWFAGARLAVVLASSLVAWIYRTPRAPGEGIGGGAALGMLLAEWRALLCANLVYLPWENLVLRADPPLVPGGGMPVILVHGYLGNRGYLRPLARRLEALGVAPLFVPSSRHVWAPIEAFAEELHGRIEHIAAATGAPRVALVVHSMGGLIARAYLARHGAARVACLATLGSPHHGSVLAAFGRGANAREMRPGSGFLARLREAEGDSPTHGVPTISIYSRHDNLVAPQASSRLEGAREVALSGLGHISMLGSPLVARPLCAALAAAGVRIAQ